MIAYLTHAVLDLCEDHSSNPLHTPSRIPKPIRSARLAILETSRHERHNVRIGLRDNKVVHVE